MVISVISIDYLRIAVGIELLLPRRFGTHDHFLVQLMLAVIAVTLARLPHFYQIYFLRE